MMLIVAGITGSTAACVQLATQFPKWSWAFTAFVALATPIANVLRSAVREYEAPKAIPETSDK